jgi:anti-sigma regulatory factor (Ser/Thr protein kinase)
VTANATLQLTQSVEAPGTARGFALEMADRSGLGAMTSTLLLLTSELVTNAVVHGRGPVRIKLYVRDRDVVVEVTDNGPGLPQQRTPDQFAVDGRGLLLVSALSSTWGVELHDTGKTVWCSLSRGAAY